MNLAYLNTACLQCKRKIHIRHNTVHVYKNYYDQRADFFLFFFPREW